MKKNVSFEMFGVRYDMTFDTNEIDRNYDDETYAYWVIERNGKFFEVNIWKDDNGNFTDSGKVYGFSDRGNFENAGDADEEVDVKFTDEDYVMVGKKVVVNGKTYYQGSGFDEGYIYKDEKAFAENTDDVCYIPEGAFDDAEDIEIDGETYFDVDSDDTYTRKQLEELCKGYFDDEDNPIDVEYLFGELEWTYPTTLLQEFTY